MCGGVLLCCSVLLLLLLLLLCVVYHCSNTRTNFLALLSSPFVSLKTYIKPATGAAQLKAEEEKKKSTKGWSYGPKKDRLNQGGGAKNTARDTLIFRDGKERDRFCLYVNPSCHSVNPS